MSVILIEGAYLRLILVCIVIDTTGMSLNVTGNGIINFCSEVVI